MTRSREGKKKNERGERNALERNRIMWKGNMARKGGCDGITKLGRERNTKRAINKMTVVGKEGGTENGGEACPSSSNQIFRKLSDSREFGNACPKKTWVIRCHQKKGREQVKQMEAESVKCHVEEDQRTKKETVGSKKRDKHGKISPAIKNSNP